MSSSDALTRSGDAPMGEADPLDRPLNEFRDGLVAAAHRLVHTNPRSPQMGLLVLTNEVHSDLTGFSVEVSSPPADDAHTVREVVIEAGERDDGAVGHRLVIRGDATDLKKIFTSALMYFVVPDPEDIQEHPHIDGDPAGSGGSTDA